MCTSLSKTMNLFCEVLRECFFWRTPSCSGTKASQLCGILWSPHREHLRTKARATAEKYHFFLGSIFDSKKEIWRDEDVKSFCFLFFFVWFWLILRFYPTFGGGICKSRRDRTFPSAKFHVNLIFFCQKFKVAIYQGSLNYHFFGGGNPTFYANLWVNVAGISRRYQCMTFGSQWLARHSVTGEQAKLRRSWLRLHRIGPSPRKMKEWIPWKWTIFHYFSFFLFWIMGHPTMKLF